MFILHVISWNVNKNLCKILSILKAQISFNTDSFKKSIFRKEFLKTLYQRVIFVFSFVHIGRKLHI